MRLKDRAIRKARREFNRHFKGNWVWTEFPRVIQVDTNNYCGQKYCGIHCVYCYPQWQIAKGNRGFMEMPIAQIEWIIKQMSLYGQNMGFVDYFLNGDGLTEPRLPEILALSKRYCPRLYTQTFTNGVLTENVDCILDKNLDNINFTISAHNRELYKIVHGGDHFEDAIKTLAIVLDGKREDERVEVHCVLNRFNYDCAQDWWDYFGNNFPDVVRVLSPLVASYNNIPSMNAMGNLTLGQMETRIREVTKSKGVFWDVNNIPYQKPCNLWDNLSFDVEGYVLQCCNWSIPQDWNYGTIDQAIKEGRSLKDIWMERLANRMRNSLCRSCNMKAPDWEKRLMMMKVYAKR